ncbi:MAG: TauD/TfdA family dioxygenase [Rhodospirillales bacterium]|nr:TauD/TfdA family dioxygenase [Rhodospirillales bacterium]
MFSVEPSGAVLGATVHDLDAAAPLDAGDFARLLVALGRHGVLRLPDQHLTDAQLRAFSERFGEIQGSVAKEAEAGHGVPEVGVLSNIQENGRYIGFPDAGQDWHTDMSYRDVMGFVNVLYGVVIPRRDGRPLGGTEFANMHAAYEALPAALRARLADATVTHDFNQYWENARRHGADRPPLTDAQRRARPPVVHPLFLTHPLTGRKVLYCNPGYAARINELPEDESAETLSFLFAHQTREEFRWTHTWSENDLLVWDHLGTIHRAIADYRRDERRLIRRCQVMATKVFSPDFLAPIHAAQAAM